ALGGGSPAPPRARLPRLEPGGEDGPAVGGRELPRLQSGISGAGLSGHAARAGPAIRPVGRPGLDSAGFQDLRSDAPSPSAERKSSPPRRQHGVAGSLDRRRALHRGPFGDAPVASRQPRARGERGGPSEPRGRLTLWAARGHPATFG